jgi:thiamine-phosphate pyrophosphorylase
MASRPAPHPTSELLRTAHFYAILDASYIAPEQFAPMCRAVLAGGADIVQVRAKKADKAAYRKLLELVLPQFEDNEIPLIVNDHLDIALEYPRCGLHIGQEDATPAEARKALGPDRVIGLSTHSAQQAARAIEMADLLSYFCIGPVFPTRTKPDYVPVGLDLVCQANVLNAGLLPLFSIGGITRENVGMIRAAGVQRIVVVSDVLQADNPQAAARELRAAVA